MMQSAWRVIDCIDVEGWLRYDRGRLIVCPDNKPSTQIPLSQTAVVLLGLKACCSTALLFKLAENGISVLLCDWRGVPVGAMHSWGDPHTLVTQRHWAQVSMSEPRMKNAWMRIVKAKIQGQAHCLDLCHREGGDTLREWAKHVRSGDTTNLEGTAARFYWEHLFAGDEDFHRVPKDGEGRNAQLDYGYAVLRGFVIRSICAAGLSPTFGVNHHNRSNYFCLADDLIEPYRPAIDSVVAGLDSDASLADKSIKRVLIETSNQVFADNLTIPTSISDLAQRFGAYCEATDRVLDVPVFNAVGGHEEG